MNTRTFLSLISGVTFLLAGGAAHAHPGHGGGLAAGLMHPFAGADHLLALLAVGLWAAQAEGWRRWAIPLIFPVLMAPGAVAAAGATVPALEPLLAASVLALGLFVSLRIRAYAAGLVLIGAFALLHGAAHSAALAASAAAVPYLAGLVAATALLHLAGLAAGLRLRLTARWAGAPIALAGCWLLAGALAG